MELVFRIRAERLDKHGRAAILADIHWPGHRLQLGTGVSVEPGNWQPAKAKPIHTREAGANQKNLKLAKLLTELGNYFTRAETEKTPDARAAALAKDAVKRAALLALDRQVEDEQPAGQLASLSPKAAWSAFNERWQQENLHLLAASTRRLYYQVVDQLTVFQPSLRLQGLTKEVFARYVAWLFEQGKKDSTVQRHYNFLRECHRLAGLPVPRWLEKFTPRYGRAPSLKKAELRQLIAAELPPGPVSEERDVFVFQTLLLLRDIELREMKPHHVSEVDLPGVGPTLCAELYQEKTGEPVLVPLPPPAAAAWRRWGGRLPLPTQQERNSRIKQLGEAAGLTREFVQVRFSGKKKHEDVGPLWQYLTTHTARHTGADMITLGSEGDQNLKECALGHVSASVYGYDTIERYGPALLAAWRAVLAPEPALAQPVSANDSEGIIRRFSFR